MFAGSALIRLALYSVFPDSAAGVSYGANWQGENLFLAIVAFAVVPAMTEEFLFRGIVLTEYESLGIPFAVILSSLLFSMMHLNLMQLPTYFYCGVILAVVLYTTRSVFASMAVHLMNNIATLLFDHFVYSMAENAEERSVLFSFLLLCVLFVSLILLFMEAQRIYAGYGITGVPSPHVHPKKKKEPIGIADMLLSPALIIFVILFFVISLIKQ
jgi:membrane protease YdiL (CAAX protease family)